MPEQLIPPSKWLTSGESVHGWLGHGQDGEAAYVRAIQRNAIQACKAVIDRHMENADQMTAEGLCLLISADIAALLPEE